MAQQSINIGTNPNDGTGDPLRTAFSKCNSNFTDLYTTSYATNVVNSFNTRVGAVTLTSADVSTALTYTPANKAGDTFTGIAVFNAGWVSGALSTMSNNAASLTALPAVITGTSIRAIQVDGTATRFLADSFVNSAAPTSGLTVRGARGTGAAPAALQAGDVFGSFTAHGFGQTVFQATSTGAIEFIADTGSGNFTDASQPTSIAFLVTPTASITKQEVMRVSSGQTTGNPYVNISSTTASVTATSGSLVVAGGVGISGNVNLGSSSIFYADGGTRYNVSTVGTATAMAPTFRYYLVTAATTMTLPTAVGFAGLIFTVKNTLGSGVVTMASTSSQTINGGSAGSVTVAAGASTNFISDGSNWWTV